MAELKERVETLLANIKELLDDIKNNQDILLEEPSIPDGVWDDVENTLETATRRLNYMNTEDFAEQLKTIDLQQRQLDWEIDEYDRIYRDYKKVAPDISKVPLTLRGPIKGIIRRLLKWLNVILGSLIPILPLLQPVKELKEGIEQKVS